MNESRDPKNSNNGLITGQILHISSTYFSTILISWPAAQLEYFLQKPYFFTQDLKVLFKLALN